MGLLSLSWYIQALLVAVFAVGYYLYRYSRLALLLPTKWVTSRSIRKRGEKLGCQAPYRETSWFFGLDKLREQIKANREHRGLERGTAIFRDSGSNTHTKFFLGKYLIITIEPENIKSVLATDFHSYGLENLRKAFVPLLGAGGIFTSDGDAWKHSRDSLRSSFTRSHISDVKQFEPHMQNLIRAIPKDGSTLNLAPLLYNLAMDISTEFLFGESTNALTGGAMTAEMSRFLNAWEFCVMHFTGERNGFRALLFDHPAFAPNIKIVQGFMDKIIARQSLRIKSEGGPSKDTFLGGLLESTTSPEKLRTECMNVLLAGRDTTSAILFNIFSQLTHDPRIDARLRREIATLPNPPTYDDLKDLKYLRAFINEALRLYPVIPFDGREAVKDTTLPKGGGKDGQSPIFVPEGTLVAYHVYALHRRKDLYGPDADDFKPERWLDEGDRKGIRPSWGYVPFNGGPRICIGQQFAITEISYVVARLLQELPVIESRDPEPWKELLTVTLSSLNGCKVAIPATKV